MQQTSSREMEGGQMNNNQENNGQSQTQQQQQQHYQGSQNDDFIEQMLSTIPNCSWPPTPHELHSPSSNNPTENANTLTSNLTLKPGDSARGDPDASAAAAFQYPFDEASLVAKLQQQQMNEVTAKSLLLQHQQQFLLSRSRSPADAMLSLPMSLGNPDSVENSSFRAQAAAEASVQALYNGLARSVVANGQPANQQHFQPPLPPNQGGSLGGGHNCGGQGAGNNQASPASALTGGSNGAGAPQRQRVRARRGQATDPHSIAERLRRERIAERMKALQELVPNANKTDKASMLDEIIDYVKFLQLQVKVLSMSRLGGAAAVAPLVADMTAEGGVARSCNEKQSTATNDSITVSEHQVAKLLEEDMGSAMQYLQGKGLCLMPISLANAISTATSISRAPTRPYANNNGNLHDIDANSNSHPFLTSVPSTNGEGNDPNPDSSVKES